MPKLKTETNTPRMERRILAAFAASGRGGNHTVSADFEHGQWWITSPTTGAAWSVVDAEGRSAIDGFDFEQVADGAEDY